MSELKHWEKTIEFKNYKFKLKKLDPITFFAFKTMFGKAAVDDSEEAIVKRYKTVASWILDEVTELPIYNKESNMFVIDELNDLEVGAAFIEQVIVKVITPLFQSTTESPKK